MYPQIEQFLKYLEAKHNAKMGHEHPSGYISIPEYSHMVRPFLHHIERLPLHREAMLKRFLWHCAMTAHCLVTDSEAPIPIDVNLYDELATFLSEVQPPIIEGFNDYVNNKIVIACYHRPRTVNANAHVQVEMPYKLLTIFDDYWVNPYRVINRREGNIPYLLGLGGMAQTSWYLVYVPKYNPEIGDLECVLDTVCDIVPHLVQCDPSDYHEDDVSYYGENNVPVYAETVRVIVKAEQVIFNADYFSLFEGEYTFPKDRK